MKQPDARDPRTLSAFERRLLESAAAPLRPRSSSAYGERARALGLCAVSGIRTRRCASVDCEGGPAQAARGVDSGRVCWPRVWQVGTRSHPRPKPRRPQPSAAVVSAPQAAPTPIPARSSCHWLRMRSRRDRAARPRPAQRYAAARTLRRCGALAAVRERFSHGALARSRGAADRTLLASGRKSDARPLGRAASIQPPRAPLGPAVRQLLGAR